MLPARTTSIARLGYVRPAGAAPPAARLRTVQSARKRFGSAQKGIWVDALGEFKDVPHIGISGAKAVRDAVTVSAEVPAVVVTVGVRPAPYRKGAVVCFCAVVK